MQAIYAGLNWQTILPSLLTSLNGDGHLRMVEVTDVGDYFDSNAKIMTEEVLFKALIGLDGDSKPAIRVSISTTEDGDFADCNTKSTDPFQNIKRCIGMDSDGVPCLRIKLDSL